MYDKAEKVMRNLSSMIFDLRAENESLYDTIEMYSKRIDELREEIQKLIHTSIVQKKQINNLQKRNSRQRLANQKQQDLILKLQEGYCKLKEECNKGIYDCTMEEYHAMANKNMELSLENEDYKSRVEKAVENLKLKQIRYVNESDYVIDDGDLQEEINILQNGSDEE